MHDRTNPPPGPVTAYATKHEPDGGWREGHTFIDSTMSRVPCRTTGHGPDQAVAELGRRYPRATIWFGAYTGNYWALIRAENGMPQLIEKSLPEELSRYLASLDSLALEHDRPRPFPLPTSRYNSAPPVARTATSAQSMPGREAPGAIEWGRDGHPSSWTESGRDRC